MILECAKTLNRAGIKMNEVLADLSSILRRSDFSKKKKGLFCSKTVLFMAEFG